MSNIIESKVLFNASQDIEITPGVYLRPTKKFSGHQYQNGRNAPSGHPTRAPGTYSLALYAYKYFKSQELNVISSEDKKRLLIEWPKHRVFAEDTNTGWVVSCSENRLMSSVSEATVLGVLGAFSEDLFDPQINDDSPEYFCDAVYYGFAQKNKVEDVEMSTSMFERMTNDILNDPGRIVICGTAPEPTKAAKKKAAPRLTVEEEYDKMLKGEYRIDYEWDPTVVGNIPEVKSALETVPTKPLIKLAKLIKAYAGDAAERIKKGEEPTPDDYLNIQCPGPVGSGKTLSAKVIGEVMGLPTYLLTATPEDYADELTQGVTKFEGGEPVHRPSPIAKWMEHGGLLLIDEMVMGRPDQYFAALAQVLENPYHIYDDGIREIKRHPLAICAMAYNNGIVGGKTISQPLISRFANTVRFDVQDRSVFIEALKRFMEHKDYPYDKEKLAEWMYDVFDKTVEYLKKSKATDALSAISLRACQGVLRQIQIGESPMEALECIWAPVEHYTPKYGYGLRDDIFPSLRDIETY